MQPGKTYMQPGKNKRFCNRSATPSEIKLLSLIHFFIPLFSSIDSPYHLLLKIYSFIHALIHLFTHPFILSFIHLFIHSFTHLLIN